MICVEVRLGNFEVASSTLTHDLKFESLQIGPSYRVSTMAIAAYRQFFVRLRNLGRVNAFNELLFNSVVTPAACRGDIAAMNG
jgi:hypothetical protein